MILSVSRRTDIPAYYSDWLINRFEAGYVLVPSPFNASLLSKVILNEKTIDFIVFWTKNPIPLMNKLHYFDTYDYCFQITLNPYNKTLEKGVPSKREIINALKNLSERIGRNRIIWRYDPIFFTDTIDINYHLKWFSYLADSLKPHVHHCVISILDEYRHSHKAFSDHGIRVPQREEVHALYKALLEIGRQKDIIIKACSEPYQFNDISMPASSCIDKDLISELTGKTVVLKKDKNQRKECGCVESIDIGAYNTCPGACAYCYANHKAVIDKRNTQPGASSEMLSGTPKGHEKIVKRKNKSIFDNALTLIDL